MRVSQHLLRCVHYVLVFIHLLNVANSKDPEMISVRNDDSVQLYLTNIFVGGCFRFVCSDVFVLDLTFYEVEMKVNFLC